MSAGAVGWDPAGATHYVTKWVAPSYERLFINDFEGLGPRGKNVYSFANGADSPQTFYKPHLLESYEMPDSTHLILHVRKGIHFHDKPPVNGRELEAKDVVVSLNRLHEVPRFNTGYMEFVDEIEAVDKYTVKITMGRYDYTWPFWLGIGSYVNIYPYELVEQELINKWEYVAGTGPFILKDYVTDVGGTYVRNPDYWDTATIEGKEYELPFVDSLRVAIVPEKSTRLSAFRTGKLDLLADPFNALGSADQEDLEKTAPDALFSEFLFVGVPQVVLIRMDQGPPVDNIKVRKALSMAIDWEEYNRLVYNGKAIKPYYLIVPQKWDPAMETPVEELPAELIEGHTYNPEKAKQLLAEAGYPEGFKIAMDLAAVPDEIDAASVIKEQWKKIGVELELNTMEFVALQTRASKQEHSMLVLSNPSGTPASMMSLQSVTSTHNATLWSPPGYEELRKEILQEADPAKRAEKIKKINILHALGFHTIPLAVTSQYNAWWPWLKNYYGEGGAGYHVPEPVLARIWIDEDLKKELGF